MSRFAERIPIDWSAGQLTPNEEARLWRFVVVVESCWEWCGAVRRGYGRAYFRGALVSAHYLFYENNKGVIEAGKVLDHTCENKRCVNPSHLRPASIRENTLRGNSVTSVCAARTSCPSGHPYDAANTKYRPNGSRRCKACIKIQGLARRAALAKLRGEK